LDSKIKEQVFGAIANVFDRLFHLADDRKKQIYAGQDEAFNSAAAQINKVLESMAKHNKRLGSLLSKPGKIAEPVEVGIHNARQALDGKGTTATVDGIGKTVPKVRANDIPGQSKFTKGINKNMDHLIAHNMAHSKNLGHEGASFSQTPTESHATVPKVNVEQGEGLANKSVTHVTDKVQTLDENAAKQVVEVAQHGNSASADKNMDHLIAQMDHSNLGHQGTSSQSPTDSHAAPTVKPAEPGDGLAHNNATVPTVKPAETGDGLAHNNATVPTVKPAESGEGLAHNSVTHVTDKVHHQTLDENAAKPVAEVTQHGNSASADKNMDHLIAQMDNSHNLGPQGASQSPTNTQATVPTVKPAEPGEGLAHNTATAPTVKPTEPGEGLAHTATVPTVKPTEPGEGLAHNTATVPTVKPAEPGDGLAHNNATVPTVKPTETGEGLAHNATTVPTVKQGGEPGDGLAHKSVTHVTDKVQTLDENAAKQVTEVTQHGNSASADKNMDHLIAQMDHSNLGHQGTSSRSPTDSHAAPTVKPTELGDGLAHNNATVLKVNGEPGDGLAHKSVTHPTNPVQTLDENAAKPVAEVAHGKSGVADKNMDHLIAQMDHSNLGHQGTSSQSPTDSHAAPTVKPTEPGDGLAHNNATVPKVNGEPGDGLAHKSVTHPTNPVQTLDENAAKPVAEVAHGKSGVADKNMDHLIAQMDHSNLGHQGTSSRSPTDSHAAPTVKPTELGDGLAHNNATVLKVNGEPGDGLAHKSVTHVTDKVQTLDENAAKQVTEVTQHGNSASADKNMDHLIAQMDNSHNLGPQGASQSPTNTQATVPTVKPAEPGDGLAHNNATVPTVKHAESGDGLAHNSVTHVTDKVHHQTLDENAAKPVAEVTQHGNSASADKNMDHLIAQMDNSHNLGHQGASQSPTNTQATVPTTVKHAEPGDGLAHNNATVPTVKHAEPGDGLAHNNATVPTVKHAESGDGLAHNNATVSTVKHAEQGDGLAHNKTTVSTVKHGEPGDGLAHNSSVTHLTNKVQSLNENAAKPVAEVAQHGNSASADKNMDHLIAQMDNSHNLSHQGASQTPTETHATVPKVGEPGNGLAHNNATVPTVKPAESGDGLAHNRVIHLTDNVHRFDENAAKPVAEVTQHGHSGTAEIQQGTLRTLDRHEDELANRETQLRHEHKLSFQDGLKATEVATAVGVAVSVTNGLYQKHKAGKRFYKGDFTVEDWKEIGGDTLKGGAIGGVSGAAIYGITRYAPLSAPFAGAVVSATKGVASLITDYHSGKINVNEFFELGMVICAESAIVGIATAAGQTVIPIPILGAVLGSVAGSMFVKIISKTDRKTATKILREIKGYIQKLDAVTQALITKINAEFDKLGELTKAAFSFENNEKLLQNSIYLASAYGVDENQLIKSHTELDKFILR
jgi:hypothetical protein